MLHPRRYITPVTFELITDIRLEASDVRTWLVIASLASYGSAANDQREFISPGRETMARLCNCTINTLRASYDRLRNAGWITELPRDEGHATRISIKIPEPTIAWQTKPLEARVPASESLHNMYSCDPTKMSESAPPPKAVQQLIPKFPPDVIRLADSICLRDLSNVPYPLPSIVTLWIESRRASMDDMRKGLIVLKRYMDKDAPVYGPTSLWRSLFNDEGRFVVKKRNIGTRSESPAKDLPNSTRVERLQAASDLSKGLTVEIGRLDPYLRAMLLEKDAIDVRGPHAQLKTNFDLTYDLPNKKFTVAILTPDGEEEHTPQEDGK